MPTDQSLARRMKLLERIASLAEGRHDIKVNLMSIDLNATLVTNPDQSLTFGDNGYKFKSSTYGELAYDLNNLLSDGNIEIRFTGPGEEYSPSKLINSNSVFITKTGLDKLAEYQRSWLSKSIEKQPITFLQIIVTVGLAILTGVIGFIFGKITN